MRKVLMASVAAMGMALAGPALADCADEIATAEAGVQATQTIGADMQEQAAATLAEAEASLAAGDEEACMASVAEVQAMIGADPNAAATTDMSEGGAGPEGNGSNDNSQ